MRTWKRDFWEDIEKVSVMECDIYIYSYEMEGDYEQKFVR